MSQRQGGERLAVVLVHYHGPSLVERAWEALEQEATATGFELEGVVIDNGSSAEEQAHLEALPPLRIDPGKNLGYAGGINLGLRSTTAKIIVALNPDVQVLPRCLRSLVDELGRGAAVAGPRFYWDRRGGFLLPPTERRSRKDELLRSLSGLPGFGALALRRWRSHARAHWRATQPFSTPDLSGALLAFRREAWEDVAFDEAFPLYFEETDWLLRLRAQGWDTVHVPAAEALHAYAQSTRHEPLSQAWFVESEHRFRLRHYGPGFTRFLDQLGARLPGSSSPTPQKLTPSPRTGAFGLTKAQQKEARWLEVSPTPRGFPAAEWQVEPDSPLPTVSELARLLSAEAELWARIVDARGRTLALRQLGDIREDCVSEPGSG